MYNCIVTQANRVGVKFFCKNLIALCFYLYLLETDYIMNVTFEISCIYDRSSIVPIQDDFCIMSRKSNLPRVIEYHHCARRRILNNSLGTRKF